MNFSNNLQQLRKEYKLSQEDLAEKLNVSRQAISKWESGNGFPEMDKIIQICDIFKCSMDELMKGRILKSNSLKDTINKEFHKFGLMISIGVFLIIIACSLFVFFENYNLDELFSVLFMIIIMISVVIFIYYGMKHNYFMESNSIDNIYTNDEKAAYEKKFMIAITLGVGFIIFGICLIMFFDAIFSKYENIATGLFLIITAISTSIFIYYGVNRSKFDSDNNVKKNIEKDDELIGKVCGTIMLLTTALYLYLGFAYNGFGIYWYVFPIGGILCAIASILLKKN